MQSRRAPDQLPADWLPAKTLTQLRLQLDALQQFKGRKCREAKAEHSSWFDNTAMIIRCGFGTQHPNFFDFNFSGYAVGEYQQYEREEVKEQLNFEARVKKEESCINTYIRELELMLPDEPSSQEVAPPWLDACSQVLFLCRRFHRFATALANRSRGKSAVVVNDEYDVQYLLNALLRVHFDDVRSEDPAPSYAGASARVDFVLKTEQIAVEAKMTRSGLRDKEVANELLLDIARYKERGDCKILVCLVYDPSHLIANPHGLRIDLTQMSNDRLSVEVVIVPEP